MNLILIEMYTIDEYLCTTYYIIVKLYIHTDTYTQHTYTIYYIRIYDDDETSFVMEQNNHTV
jgi:hypothetical protein